MSKTRFIHEKPSGFIEKARELQYNIEENRKKKKIDKEKRYRAWLKNPKTKKGKQIKLLSLPELVKMKNRFAIITLISWLIASLCTTVFLEYLLEYVAFIGIFLGTGLMGFAHAIMYLSVDWSIYRRFGNEKSFFDW